MIKNSFLALKDKIFLQRYEEKDLKELYELFLLYSGEELMRYDNNFFNSHYFEFNFLKSLKKRYIKFRLLKKSEEEKYIGFIYCYNYEEKNKTIFFDILMKSEKYYEKDILELIKQYLSNIKKEKDIRLIYSHSLSNQDAKLSFLKKCDFKIIGNMKEYRYYNGKYLDMKILQLS